MVIIKKKKNEVSWSQIRAGRMTKVLIQRQVDGARQRGKSKRNWIDLQAIF